MIQPLSLIHHDEQGLFQWKVDPNEDMYKYYYVKWGNIRKEDLQQEIFDKGKLLDQDLKGIGFPQSNSDYDDEYGWD